MSFSSVIDLSITFVQYFSSIVEGRPDFSMPDMKEAAVVTDFFAIGFDTISSWIPAIGDDFRIYFTMVAVVVPLIIIFLGISFLNPLRVTLWYLLLLISILLTLVGAVGNVAISMVAGSSLNIQLSDFMLLLCLILGPSMLALCLLALWQRETLLQFGAAPRSDKDTVEERMKEETEDCACTTLTMRLVLTSACIFFGLLFVNFFDLANINIIDTSGAGFGSFSIIFGYLLFSIGSVMLIYMIVGFCQAGRELQWKAGAFLEENFLRLFLIMLSILYIPLVSPIFLVFNVNDFECPADYRLKDSGSVMPANTTGQKAVCQSCIVWPEQKCPLSLQQSVCAQGKESRLEADLTLTASSIMPFFWPAAGLMILATVLAIPLVFYDLITKSVELLREKFPVRDISPEEKAMQQRKEAEAKEKKEEEERQQQKQQEEAAAAAAAVAAAANGGGGGAPPQSKYVDTAASPKEDESGVNGTSVVAAVGGAATTTPTPGGGGESPTAIEMTEKSPQQEENSNNESPKKGGFGVVAQIEDQKKKDGEEKKEGEEDGEEGEEETEEQKKWRKKVLATSNVAKFLWEPFLPKARYMRLFFLIQKLINVFLTQFVIRISNWHPTWIALGSNIGIHTIGFIGVAATFPFLYAFENGIALAMELILTVTAVLSVLVFADIPMPTWVMIMILICNGVLPVVALIIAIVLEWTTSKSDEEEEEQKKRKELQDEIDAKRKEQKEKQRQREEEEAAKKKKEEEEAAAAAAAQASSGGFSSEASGGALSPQQSGDASAVAGDVPSAIAAGGTGDDDVPSPPGGATTAAGGGGGAGDDATPGGDTPGGEAEKEGSDGDGDDGGGSGDSTDEDSSDDDSDDDTDDSDVDDENLEDLLNELGDDTAHSSELKAALKALQGEIEDYKNLEEEQQESMDVLKQQSAGTFSPSPSGSGSPKPSFDDAKSNKSGDGRRRSTVTFVGEEEGDKKKKSSDSNDDDSNDKNEAASPVASPTSDDNKNNSAGDDIASPPPALPHVANDDGEDSNNNNTGDGDGDNKASPSTPPKQQEQQKEPEEQPQQPQQQESDFSPPHAVPAAANNEELPPVAPPLGVAFNRPAFVPPPPPPVPSQIAASFGSPYSPSAAAVAGSPSQQQQQQPSSSSSSPAADPFASMQQFDPSAGGSSKNNNNNNKDSAKRRKSSSHRRRSSDGKKKKKEASPTPGAADAAPSTSALIAAESDAIFLLDEAGEDESALEGVTDADLPEDFAFMSRQEQIAVRRKIAAKKQQLKARRAEKLKKLEALLEKRRKEAEQRLMICQRNVDFEINSIVKDRLNCALMIQGIFGLFALAFCAVGLLASESVFLSVSGLDGVRLNTTEFVGYSGWDQFTSKCCCTASMDVNSTPHVAVEKWICENGKTKERVREYKPYGNSTVESGFVIRSLCNVSFEPQCTLYNTPVTTGVGVMYVLCGGAVGATKYAEKNLW